MKRPSRQLLTALGLLAALPFLPGCGGGEEAGQSVAVAQREEPREPDPGERTDGGIAELRITGGHAFVGAFNTSCGLFPDTGLTLTFDRPGTDTPQVELRIADYMGDSQGGSYPATLVVRPYYSEPGGQDAPESLGTAQVQISSVQVSEPSPGTLFSGSFTGTYTGGAGTGEVAGTFERCFFRELTD